VGEENSTSRPCSKNPTLDNTGSQDLKLRSAVKLEIKETRGVPGRGEREEGGVSRIETPKFPKTLIRRKRQ